MDCGNYSSSHAAAIAFMACRFLEQAYGMLIHDPFRRDKIDSHGNKKNPDGNKHLSEFYLLTSKFPLAVFEITNNNNYKVDKRPDTAASEGKQLNNTDSRYVRCKTCEHQKHQGRSIAKLLSASLCLLHRLDPSCFRLTPHFIQIEALGVVSALQL